MTFSPLFSLKLVLLLHLRDVKGEVQRFSRQSLGRAVPHPADLQVGQVALRVAVHRVNEAGRARHHQLQDV